MRICTFIAYSKVVTDFIVIPHLAAIV